MTMRAEFKKQENQEQSSMTAERIAKLNNVGFDWDATVEFGRYDCKSYKSSIRTMAIVRVECLQITNKIHLLERGCQQCDKCI